MHHGHGMILYDYTGTYYAVNHFASTCLWLYTYTFKRLHAAGRISVVLFRTTSTHSTPKIPILIKYINFKLYTEFGSLVYSQCTAKNTDNDILGIFFLIRSLI